MRITLLIIGTVLAAVNALGPEPELKFAWKQIDYEWPSADIKEKALKSGQFVQENNLPLGLARWKNKVFITVPKWKNGVASTLNYVDIDGPIDQPLKPYPNLESNLVPDDATELKTNTSMVSVFRVFVDACDRLWAMDTGLADILGSPNQVTGPAILVFDLKTDTLIKRYPLKVGDMKEDSFFANIVVDVDKNKCDDAYAYIPDLGGYGLVVYSLAKDDSWRVTHHYFHFDPLSGEYSIGGVEFHWTDGVFAVALSEPRENGYRTAFFHPLSSTKEFCVSTELLRNYTLLDKEQAFHDFKILGDRGLNTQSSASFFHPKTNTLFYTQVNRYGVGCWNAAVPYMPETNPLIMSNPDTMEFLNDLKVDDEDYLWLLSDKMPKFLHNLLKPDEVNYRIFRIKAEDAIKGSACQLGSARTKRHPKNLN